MTEDAFVIFIPDSKPMPPIAKVESPLEPAKGRYFCDLTPAQQARVLRLQAGLYFYEPIFDEHGMTGRWRVGKSERHMEFTIAEFANKDEARACLLKLLCKA